MENRQATTSKSRLKRNILFNLTIDFLAILLSSSTIFILKHDHIWFFKSYYMLFVISFFGLMTLFSLLIIRYSYKEKSAYYIHFNRFLAAYFLAAFIIILTLHFTEISQIKNKIVIYWLLLLFLFECLMFAVDYTIKYISKLNEFREDELSLHRLSSKNLKKDKTDELTDDDDLLNSSDNLLDISDETRSFIKQFNNNHNKLFVNTTRDFNIAAHRNESLNLIVNFQFINPVRNLNKFFETVNSRLSENGVFILCLETMEMRKTRILRQYFAPISWILLFFDYFFNRFWLNIPYIRQFYFWFNSHGNKRISYAEALGRLYCSGFEHIAELKADGFTWFALQKKQLPISNYKANLGPLIKLKRIGQGGKEFFVYKFRTMYPYSEFLQEFIYKKHHLDETGKFKNDFRITPGGRFARKFWLDEIPMIINLIAGQIKLFGVRPLSKQYFNLYPESLRELRTQVKPGLIPPYYSDLPENLDHIVESEIQYLKSYQANRFKTDSSYFFRAIYNIVVKNARSM